MPRDLFGDVVRPSISIGSRKWYTLPDPPPFELDKPIGQVIGDVTDGPVEPVASH